MPPDASTAVAAPTTPGGKKVNTIEEMLQNPSEVLVSVEEANKLLDENGSDYIKSGNTAKKIRALLSSEESEDNQKGLMMLIRAIIGRAWWSQVNPKAKFFGLLRKSQEIEKDLRWGSDFEGAVESAMGFLEMLAEKKTKADEAEDLIGEIIDLCDDPTAYLYFMEMPTADDGLHGWMRDFIDSVLDGEAKGPHKSLQMTRDALVRLEEKRKRTTKKPARPTNHKKAAARKKAAAKRPPAGPKPEPATGGDPNKPFVVLGDPNPQGVPGMPTKRGAAVPGAGKKPNRR